MSFRIKRISQIALFAILSVSLNVMAQAGAGYASPADSTQTITLQHNIFFKVDYSIYDPDRRGNSASMDSAVSEILAAAQVAPDYTVTVTGSTSPDGSYAANARLATNRARTVADILASRLPDEFKSHLTTVAMGEDWETLARLAEASGREWAGEMASILLETPAYTYDSQGKINGGRKEDMGNLRGGEAYRFMKDNFFDEIRYARIEISYSKPVEIETEPSVQPEPEIETEPEPEPQPVEEEPQVYDQPSYDDGPTKPMRKIMALKTNLAFDLMTAVNAEVEVPIGKRLSLNAEYTGPWWLIDHNGGQYCLQTSIMQFEGRYWFPRRYPRNSWENQPLTGFFVGAYGGTGRYDIEKFDHGKQGIFWDAGLGVGYSTCLSKRMSFEFELGIGYFDTRYEAYRARKNNTILQYIETKRTTLMFYPTRAHASLVWNIYNKRK